jgi:hypothetical protein
MLGLRFDFSKCIHMCGHLLTRRRIMQHNSPLLPAFVCLSHNLLSPYRLCKVPATEIMLLHTTYWKNNWVNYTIFINFYMPKYFKMKQIYALFFCKIKIKFSVLVDWMKAPAIRRRKKKPTKKTRSGCPVGKFAINKKYRNLWSWKRNLSTCWNERLAQLCWDLNFWTPTIHPSIHPYCRAQQADSFFFSSFKANFHTFFFQLSDIMLYNVITIRVIYLIQLY